jgi:glycosyltransferase involved in cell wall biosynthesis
VRACFVVRGAAWSGAARAFADAASLLSARGYETCLVAPAESEVERELRGAGHDVVGVRTAGGWVRAGWRLRAVVARRLSEVLFVHDDAEHLAAAAAIRFAGRGAVVRRTPPGERLTIGRDGRLAMRLAATGFVFTHADDLRGMAPPRGALAAHIAPPGVTPLAATAAAIGAIQGARVRRIALFAGAGRVRDAFVALRALALLAPRLPDLRATVFAPAEELDAARLEAAALGVSTRIEWRPSTAERGDVLAEASLAWVIASADDAVYAMLDALAHGVPVIAERSPLAARILDDGISGVLRHRGDEAEWASVVAATLARTDALEEMRRGALRAAARFPMDSGAEGWLQVTEAARDRTRWSA